MRGIGGEGVDQRSEPARYGAVLVSCSRRTTSDLEKITIDFSWPFFCACCWDAVRGTLVADETDGHDLKTGKYGVEYARYPGVLRPPK